MRIGVPKEIKNQEYRVGLTPASVRELTAKGHEVFVETKAGSGINKEDDAYAAAGGKIVKTPEEIFQKAEMIVKVKEPLGNELKMLKKHHILFTYLHLAADRPQAEKLLETGCTAIAYETITDSRGRLPLLMPMSEVAGHMSIQVGAACLEKNKGGRGVLMGGVSGVPAADVVVLGGGVVGTNAARMALGMGANVTIIDRSLERLRELDLMLGSKAQTLFATAESIETSVLNADLVIGAALVPGDSAPKMVSRAMLKKMRKGSVLVDVSIDQGGCFESSRPTSHDHPTYIEEGIVHYCVSNMPGAVAQTSSAALNNATLPFVMELAEKGIKAIEENPNIANGLNVCAGCITHPGVAHALSKTYVPPSEALKKL